MIYVTIKNKVIQAFTTVSGMSKAHNISASHARSLLSSAGKASIMIKGIEIYKVELIKNSSLLGKESNLKHSNTTTDRRSTHGGDKQQGSNWNDTLVRRDKSGNVIQ